MAAPQPETRPPQAAPRSPLPPYRLHSDEFALYQSNHSAALFPKFPSVTCLEEKESWEDKQEHVRAGAFKKQDKNQIKIIKHIFKIQSAMSQ